MKRGQLLALDWARLCTLSGNPHSRLKWQSYFSPRFLPVLLVRLAHSIHEAGYPRLAKLVSAANLLGFGLEVPPRLVIGPGLVLPHPNGVVLGARIIGMNATIFQQVTIGAVELDFQYNESLRPTIGDSVTLGAGAKILGSLSIGDGAKVGANAVVLQDVAPEGVAVGVPARVIHPAPTRGSD